MLTRAVGVGKVASAYSGAHPDKVAGIVMVDPTFDEEVTLEDVGPGPRRRSPCDPSNRKIDGEQSLLQKIDNCAIYKWAYERRHLRPEVPLVFLAAKQAPWSDNAEFGPTQNSAARRAGYTVRCSVPLVNQNWTSLASLPVRVVPARRPATRRDTRRRCDNEGVTSFRANVTAGRFGERDSRRFTKRATRRAHEHVVRW